MNTILIESWQQFSDVLHEYRDENWIFRGVTNADYELIPTIGRGNSRVTRLSYDVHDECEIFERFKRAGRPLTHLIPPEELGWIALAQHHGLPTRLLDWTMSPLVAAYFACDVGQTSGPDRAVYGAPAPRLADNNDRTRPFRPSKRPIVKLVAPDHLSPRITVQRSLFTLHSRPDYAWKPRNLIRWVIPANQTLTFKKTLDVCGINKASLFPDLDGIAGYLRWQYWRGRL